MFICHLVEVIKVGLLHFMRQSSLGHFFKCFTIAIEWRKVSYKCFCARTITVFRLVSDNSLVACNDEHNMCCIGNKLVAAAIAFSLALFSHILNHVTMRLQSALYDLENPRRIIKLPSSGNCRLRF